MTVATRRKNAKQLGWIRAVGIGALTWVGMMAMQVHPAWLPIVLAIGASLLALTNSELGVLLAMFGLCLPLIAAQPIVGAVVAIAVFLAEHYLGGEGGVGFLLIGLAVVGAFLGPVWAAAALAGCILGPGEGAFAAGVACLTVETVGMLVGRDALTVVVTGGPTPAIVSFAHAPATLLSSQWISSAFHSLSGKMVGGLFSSLGRVSQVPAMLAQIAVWAAAAAVAGFVARRKGAASSLVASLAGAGAGVLVLAMGDAAVRIIFGLPILPAASAIALVSSLAVALGFVAVRETVFAREVVSVASAVAAAEPRQVSMAAEDADVDELLRLIATAEDKLASQHTSTRVVLITDMKSFSRMTEEDGSVATAKAIQRHRDLLVPVITRHNGCGKSTGGDGVVAAFESAADAIAAAAEGQRALAEYNASHDNERDVLVRMGLASGEVVLDNGGRPFIGAGLNLAARVMNLADGGQIYATGDVIEAGKAESGPPTHSFGAFELKNIANAVQIGEVLWAEGQQPRDPRTEDTPS